MYATKMMLLPVLIILLSLIGAHNSNGLTTFGKSKSNETTFYDETFNSPSNKYARMARYILRSSKWVSLATISTSNSIKNYPYVTLKEVSDGPKNYSTGIPYLHMQDVDISGKDVAIDNRCTITTSLGKTLYCEQRNSRVDGRDCAELFITGRLIKVDASSSEYGFGVNALLEKHPSLKWRIEDNKSYIAKIYIEQVAILDYYDDITYVSIYDYLHAHEAPTALSTSQYIKTALFDKFKAISYDEDEV